MLWQSIGNSNCLFHWPRALIPCRAPWPPSRCYWGSRASAQCHAPSRAPRHGVPEAPRAHGSHPHLRQSANWAALQAASLRMTAVSKKKSLGRRGRGRRKKRDTRSQGTTRGRLRIWRLAFLAPLYFPADVVPSLRYKLFRSFIPVVGRLETLWNRRPSPPTPSGRFPSPRRTNPDPPAVQVSHQQRGLPKRRDKVWTVLHNFDCRAQMARRRHAASDGGS